MLLFALYGWALLVSPQTVGGHLPAPQTAVMENSTPVGPFSTSTGSSSYDPTLFRVGSGAGSVPAPVLPSPRLRGSHKTYKVTDFLPKFENEDNLFPLSFLPCLRSPSYVGLKSQLCFLIQTALLLYIMCMLPSSMAPYRPGLEHQSSPEPSWTKSPDATVP